MQLAYASVAAAETDSMGTDYDWANHARPFADSKETLESGDDAHSVGNPRIAAKIEAAITNFQHQGRRDTALEHQKTAPNAGAFADSKETSGSGNDAYSVSKY